MWPLGPYLERQPNLKNVLVLGGGGFIGTNLCRALLAGGHRVTTAGRAVASSPVAGPRHIEGTIGPDTDFLPMLEGQDVVVHLISGSTPASSNADMKRDIGDNLLPTISLLDACRAAATPQLIFLSSGGTIYGPDVPVPTPETAPTNPISSYGIVKLAIEKYMAMYELQGGPKSTVLRVANPYGPHQYATKGQGAIASFGRRMLAGEPVAIFGDGSVSRDYIYIDDLVSAIVATITYEGPQRLFNIGSGEGRTVLEVVTALEQALGQTPSREFKPSRPVDVPVSILSIARARAELGWQPQISWDEGIRRTIAWLRQTNA